MDFWWDLTWHVFAVETVRVCVIFISCQQSMEELFKYAMNKRWGPQNDQLYTYCISLILLSIHLRCLISSKVFAGRLLSHSELLSDMCTLGSVSLNGNSWCTHIRVVQSGTPGALASALLRPRKYTFFTETDRFHLNFWIPKFYQR